MADAIAVLNAGSSSIKFSLFLTRGVELELVVRGQIEGIYTTPHFVAKRRDGTTAAEKSWPEGTKLGHDGALDHLVDVFARELGGRTSSSASGIASCTAGSTTRSRCVVDAGVVAALEKLIPLAPLHQPHNLAPIRRLLERAPELPQVACFDTAFHRTNPDVGADDSRCPRSCTTPACGVTAFTACRTNTSPRCCRSSTTARRRAGRSCCTSATARACARSRPAAASRARWGSPPSRACRWARAAARSTPA